MTSSGWRSASPTRPNSRSSAAKRRPPADRSPPPPRVFSMPSQSAANVSAPRPHARRFEAVCRERRGRARRLARQRRGAGGSEPARSAAQIRAPPCRSTKPASSAPPGSRSCRQRARASIGCRPRAPSMRPRAAPTSGRASHQVFAHERLREIVVHAGGEAALAVAVHRVRGERDDRRSASPPRLRARGSRAWQRSRPCRASGSPSARRS